jgi:hypothetical protein
VAFEVEMTSDIQLSCPVCEELVTVSMKIDTGSEAGGMLENVVNSLMNVKGHYCFRGMVKCSCGYVVMSCLAVTAHEVGHARLAALQQLSQE